MISNFYEFKNMRIGSKSIYNSNDGVYYNRKMIRKIRKISSKMDRIDKMLNDTKQNI
jgi:hypothetical protein